MNEFLFLLYNSLYTCLTTKNLPLQKTTLESIEPIMQALDDVDGIKDINNKEPPLPQPVATPARGKSSAPAVPDATTPDTPEFSPGTTAGPFDETVPADLGLDNVPCCDSFTFDWCMLWWFLVAFMLKTQNLS